jgi:hypothetical protein
MMDGCTLIRLCDLFTAEWLTAIGTVGAVILALILALWGEKIGRWRIRPKLSLEAHVGRPESVSVRRQGAYTLTTGYTGSFDAGAAYFFRLAIRNRGNTEARDVQVFLESVERIVNGKPERIPECTPMNLVWSNRRNATLPTLLPEMPPVYCDLVHVDEPKPRSTSEEQPDAQLVLDVEFPSNTGGHALAAGTYQFGIILAAANHKPHRYKLEVIFSGTWYTEEGKMFDVGFKMRAV